MAEARRWLEAHGGPYQQKPAYHLKIGAINCWPKTGVIVRDGDNSRYPDMGLPALTALLTQAGWLSPS